MAVVPWLGMIVGGGGSRSLIRIRRRPVDSPALPLIRLMIENIEYDITISWVEDCFRKKKGYKRIDGLRAGEAGERKIQLKN